MHRRSRRQPDSAGRWLPAVLVLGVVLAAALLSLGRNDRRAREPLTPTPAVVPTPAVARVASPTAVAPVVAGPAGPTAPPAGPAPPVADRVRCPGSCLVRLPDDPAVRDQLADVGVRASYANGGWLWAVVSDPSLAALPAKDRLTLVTPTAETLPLYVVRLPEGADEAVVRAAGEVIDRAGNQLILRARKLPLTAEPLTSAGIWVEKLPPPPVVVDRRDLPPLVDVGDLYAPVSDDQIAETLLDLQRMGATDGELGTRRYDQPGNVVAVEYMARRFAAYGLDVWYEDFVADNGDLSVNVVGELPGRDRSKVYLAVAHLDSAAADHPDGSIAPGALDNGTGLAILLEVSRVLSNYQLEHPVRFVALNAEEIGLQGAVAFGERALREGTPFAGAINVDSVGPLHAERRLVVNADGPSAWLQDLVARVEADYDLGLNLVLRQNPLLAADDTPLSLAGIPAILMASVVYGDPDINREEDTIEQIDVGYVRQTARLLALTLGELVRTGAA